MNARRRMAIQGAFADSRAILEDCRPAGRRANRFVSAGSANPPGPEAGILWPAGVHRRGGRTCFYTDT